MEWGGKDKGQKKVGRERETGNKNRSWKKQIMSMTYNCKRDKEKRGP